CGIGRNSAFQPCIATLEYDGRVRESGAAWVRYRSRYRACHVRIRQLRSKKGNNEQEEKDTLALHAVSHEAPPAIFRKRPNGVKSGPKILTSTWTVKVKYTFTRWYSRHMRRGYQFLQLVLPVSVAFHRMKKALLVAIGFVSLHAFVLASEHKPMPGCALARPYITSAETALTVGDSGSAREKLKRAVEVGPECAEAHLRLGLTEFQTGATAESIPHYQRALKLQPASYSAHYNLALAYLRQQKFQE